jgi:hypothetical protein
MSTIALLLFAALMVIGGLEQFRFKCIHIHRS